MHECTYQIHPGWAATQYQRSATSDIHVPSSCTSRVVGDLAVDLLHSETIYPAVGEARTHASTPQRSNDHPQPSYPPNRSSYTNITKETT